MGAAGPQEGRVDRSPRCFQQAVRGSGWRGHGSHLYQFLSCCCQWQGWGSCATHHADHVAACAAHRCSCVRSGCSVPRGRPQLGCRTTRASFNPGAISGTLDLSTQLCGSGALSGRCVPGGRPQFCHRTACASTQVRFSEADIPSEERSLSFLEGSTYLSISGWLWATGRMLILRLDCRSASLSGLCPFHRRSLPFKEGHFLPSASAAAAAFREAPILLPHTACIPRTGVSRTGIPSGMVGSFRTQLCFCHAATANHHRCNPQNRDFPTHASC